MTYNADAQNPEAFTRKAFYTFVRGLRGLFVNRLRWIGFWVEYDKSYKIVAIGQNAYDDEPGFVKKGEPFWKCVIDPRDPVPHEKANTASPSSDPSSP